MSLPGTAQRRNFKAVLYLKCPSNTAVLSVPSQCITVVAVGWPLLTGCSVSHGQPVLSSNSQFLLRWNVFFWKFSSCCSFYTLQAHGDLPPENPWTMWRWCAHTHFLSSRMNRPSLLQGYPVADTELGVLHVLSLWICKWSGLFFSNILKCMIQWSVV